MRKCSKLVGVIGLSIVLLLSSATNAFAAGSISYTRGGNKFVYSNYPETMNTSGRFTVEAGIASNETVDVEYYHLKNSAYQANSVGVLLTNKGTEDVYVVMQRESTSAGYAYSMAGHRLDDKASAMALTNFFNKTPQNVSVRVPKDGGSAWISGPYQSTSNKVVLAGRVRFKAPNKSNLKLSCKVVQCVAGTLPNVAATYTRAPLSSAEETSGVYRYSQISATIASDRTSFYVSAYPWSEGTNEYEYLSTGYNGNNHIQGNFGIEYILSGLGGKTITLTPSDSSPAQFIYKVGNGSWQKTKVLDGKATSSPIYIPASSTFSYMLPGGNFGDVLVNIR